MTAAVLALGLLAPAAPTAFGADAPPSNPRKAAALDRWVTAGSPAGAQKSTADQRLRRLAAEKGGASDVVRLAVTARGSALEAVADAAEKQGAKRSAMLRRLSTVSVEVPRATAGLVADRLRGRSDVKSVHVVARRTFDLVPNDEKYSMTSSYLNSVTAPTAWDLRTGDASVKIAVVDSGVDVGHPDLTGRVVGTYNAVDGTADVTDVVGHGTFVAGVAAATPNNSIGIAGASFGASVLAVKVDDGNGGLYADDIAAGIVWAADHDADVINLSLGSEASDATEQAAVSYAQGKGVLVVAAAGNDGTATKSYPAAYPGVIAVGATDAAGHRATFSQYGSWVTVAAPGVAITSTSPRAGSDFFGPNYATGNGTSFSTPIVAAEAALLASVRPGLTSTDLANAITGSAHGYAGLGLGAGQVDFRAALDEIAPTTTPTLVAPSDGSTVSQTVGLAANSTAPKVQFLLDGAAFGAPVATSGGVATSSWTTWGFSNGAHSLAAADCSVGGVCGAASTPVAVTLANDAPTVTAPTEGATLSGSTTFTATSGGPVGFYVDGSRKGLDTTAPYSLTYSLSALSDGTHTLKVVQCSAGGTCNGPSASVSFVNKSLHPKFSSVRPSLFSPNKDGRSDTSKATWYLPDTETVTLRIRNSAGSVVRGPIQYGSQAKGYHAYTWNGYSNGGTRQANGTYTYELSTIKSASGGVVLRGFATATARIDLTAPSMSSITGSGSSVYPYKDGYKDTFSPRFTLSEKSTVTMTVRTSRGTVVRRITATRDAGRTSMTWTGRNTSGSQVAAGTYYWTLTADDAAGNRKVSSRYSVVVSSKKLVSKTASYIKSGSAFYGAGGSDPSCSGADPYSSDFGTAGLWLVNVCTAYEVAAAEYRFVLPSAYRYSTLKVETYGNSVAPSKLGAGFTKWGTDEYSFTPEITTGTSNAWRTVGSVAATGLVNSSRTAGVTLYVPSYYTQNDYDIYRVKVTVSYKVLA